MLEAVTDGPLVLVGSSMGGWVSLLMARAMPERLAGLITIAGAPDFTVKMWAGFSDAQRAEMQANGRLALPSDYGEPYIYTQRLIEDGRDQQVLTAPLRLDVPVRILHGAADEVVDTSVALGLFDHLEGDDIRARPGQGRRSPVFRRPLPGPDHGAGRRDPAGPSIGSDCAARLCGLYRQA